MLSKFSISAPVRHQSMYDRLLCSSAWYKRPVAETARNLTSTSIYHPEFHTDWIFIPELPVSSGTKNVYLNGYFQAHQYPRSVEEHLRKEFILRDAPTGKNLEVLNQILSSEAPVSLHVRRGDYTTIYGGRDALPMTYYQNATRAIRQHISNPTFFVFSDDIAYCRENLPSGERYIFVDHNSQTEAHEDLRLMSSCRHHIMANSTFSWWGAWLNPSPDKIVLVPDRWLDEKVPHTDLLPPSWRRIATTATHYLSQPIA